MEGTVIIQPSDQQMAEYYHYKWQENFFTLGVLILLFGSLALGARCIGRD